MKIIIAALAMVIISGCEVSGGTDNGLQGDHFTHEVTCIDGIQYIGNYGPRLKPDGRPYTCTPGTDTPEQE